MDCWIRRILGSTKWIHFRREIQFLAEFVLLLMTITYRHSRILKIISPFRKNRIQQSIEFLIGPQKQKENGRNAKRDWDSIVNNSSINNINHINAVNGENCRPISWIRKAVFERSMMQFPASRKTLSPFYIHTTVGKLLEKDTPHSVSFKFQRRNTVGRSILIKKHYSTT